MKAENCKGFFDKWNFLRSYRVDTFKRESR